ncbi:MAG TPA: plasmid pRiA4b ORF-3 family protein [Myxococcaceae bacterium]|jgi:hypothetical protein
MPRRPSPAPQSIFQLKVTLEGVKPPVWRRLLVPSDIALHKLHAALQQAMGWTNSHLHQFSLRDRRFGPISGDEVMPDLDMEDERKVRLQELVGPGQALLYEYDFGDGWLHSVLVEQRLEPDPRLPYPLCIGGARACPPEDCGGPPGYAHLLRVLNDCSHPEHDDTLTWVGGVFDPKGFNLNSVNTALAAMR